jgi:hypothetical protein
MNTFPTTAEEFYALRDDRTNRCSENRAYQNVSCAIHIPATTASTLAGQATLLVAANLLSRWCRKVVIVMPTTAMHPALNLGRGDLGELILAQMYDADPFGEFQLGGNADAAGQIILSIGDEKADIPTAATVFVNASGWLASISHREPIPLVQTEDHNTLGAIAAACLGVAQIFKLAVELPPTRHIREGVFDVFRLNWSADTAQAPWPANSNIGKILMVGGGSVGSAAAYCMRLAALAGAITAVDGDSTKVENFNRSPIFGRRMFGFPKVDAVVDILAGSAMTATPIATWWNDFIREHKRSSFEFDIWLPLANEFDVRLAMQHNVPPLMIHASTTSNWGVNHGRHIPGRDDCLADRFPAEVAAKDLACATGTVEVAGTAVDAALPFASLFAGLLVTADLVRTQLPGYPQVPNFALLDWYGPLVVQSWDKKPRPGCICQDQGRNFHNLYNRGTEHWPLFDFQ